MSEPQSYFVPRPVRLFGLMTPLAVLIGLALLLLAPNLTHWSSDGGRPPAVSSLGVQPAR